MSHHTGLGKEVFERWKVAIIAVAIAGIAEGVSGQVDSTLTRVVVCSSRRSYTQVRCCWAKVQRHGPLHSTLC
jgi:hypothetical protein